MANWLHRNGLVPRRHGSQSHERSKERIVLFPRNWTTRTTPTSNPLQILWTQLEASLSWGRGGEILQAWKVLWHFNRFPARKLLRLQGWNQCVCALAVQGPQMNIWTFVSECVLGLFPCQASSPSGGPANLQQQNHHTHQCFKYWHKFTEAPPLVAWFLWRGQGGVNPLWAPLAAYAHLENAARDTKLHPFPRCVGFCIETVFSSEIYRNPFQKSTNATQVCVISSYSESLSHSFHMYIIYMAFSAGCLVLHLGMYVLPLSLLYVPGKYVV